MKIFILLYFLFSKNQCFCKISRNVPRAQNAQIIETTRIELIDDIRYTPEQAKFWTNLGLHIDDKNIIDDGKVHLGRSPMSYTLWNNQEMGNLFF